jgi:hypothetical protein
LQTAWVGKASDHQQPKVFLLRHRRAKEEEGNKNKKGIPPNLFRDRKHSKEFHRQNQKLRNNRIQRIPIKTKQHQTRTSILETYY